MSRKTHPDKRSTARKAAARHSIGLARFDRRTKTISCILLTSLIVGVTYASWLPSKSNGRATNTTELSKNDTASPVKNVSTLSTSELADIPPEAFYPRPPQRAGYNASQGGLPPGALPAGVVLPGITQPLAPPQGYGTYDGVRQQFTSKERDNETNLDYFLARYYSSAQGRFTSVDPEQSGARNDDPQSWNAYAYARNNPLLYSDPDGRTYTVCDADGKNCVNYTDKEFDWFLKGAQKGQDGYTASNGKIYHNGELTATYSNDCLSCGRFINEMAARGPAVEKLTGAFAVVSVGVGAVAGGVAAGIGTGATVTTLGLATRAGPAAAGAFGFLNQLSSKDAAVFTRFAELGASAKDAFQTNLYRLADATFQVIGPNGKVIPIGRIGDSIVWGGKGGVGIAEVNGVQVVVKMVHGNPTILGQLPK